MLPRPSYLFSSHTISSSVLRDEVLTYTVFFHFFFYLTLYQWELIFSYVFQKLLHLVRQSIKGNTRVCYIRFRTNIVMCISRLEIIHLKAIGHAQFECIMNLKSFDFFINSVCPFYIVFFFF